MRIVFNRIVLRCTVFKNTVFTNIMYKNIYFQTHPDLQRAPFKRNALRFQMRNA